MTQSTSRFLWMSWQRSPGRPFCRSSAPCSAFDNKGGAARPSTRHGRRSGRRNGHARPHPPDLPGPWGGRRGVWPEQARPNMCGPGPDRRNKSFIAGMPAWGTLIALTRNGVPVFGMMSQPSFASASAAMGEARTIGPAASATCACAPVRACPGHAVHDEPAADERSRSRDFARSRQRSGSRATRRLLAIACWRPATSIS